MDNIKDFIDKHMTKLIGSSSAIGVAQFVSQLEDYLSDGTLDNHEIMSLFMSLASAVQAAILIAVLAYFKLKAKNNDKGKDENIVQ